MLVIEKMMCCSIEKLMPLSKNELRWISNDSLLPYRTEISKDDLIMSISNVMIHNKEEAADQALTSIEKEMLDENIC